MALADAHRIADEVEKPDPRGLSARRNHHPPGSRGRRGAARRLSGTLSGACSLQGWAERKLGAMDDNRKTILLTGASRGIGHATVKRFSEAGWNVFTSSREEVPPGMPTRPQLDATHRPPISASRARSGVSSTRSESCSTDKPLDALVNNAGVSPKFILAGAARLPQRRDRGLAHVFELNFFTPLSLGARPVRSADQGQGLHRQRHFDRRP